VEQFHALGTKSLAQPLHHPLILFEKREQDIFANEQFRKGAQTRTDLYNVVTRLDAKSLHDPPGEVLVMEKVLTQTA
jgi:hypothetical protein